MAVEVGIGCAECKEKGHFCQAETFLDIDTEERTITNVPFCLPCANNTPCRHQPNGEYIPVKRESYLSDASELEQAIIADAGATSPADLAETLKCSRSLIYKIRERHGIQNPGASASNFDRNRQSLRQAIIDDAGRTPKKELAAKLGCSEWTVWNHRSRNNIEEVVVADRHEKYKGVLIGASVKEPDIAPVKAPVLSTLNTGTKTSQLPVSVGADVAKVANKTEDLLTSTLKILNIRRLEVQIELDKLDNAIEALQNISL